MYGRIAVQCQHPACMTHGAVHIHRESEAECEECGALHESDERTVTLAPAPCPECDGEGEVETTTHHGRAGWARPHVSPYDSAVCSECNGTGIAKEGAA